MSEVVQKTAICPQMRLKICLITSLKKAWQNLERPMLKTSKSLSMAGHESPPNEHFLLWMISCYDESKLTLQPRFTAV